MFLLAKLIGSIQRRKEISAMKATRVYLLSLDDRLLEDAGFSRPLLEKGLSTWPWRDTENGVNMEIQPRTTEKELKKAASMLRSFSDKDLRDLGIGRGEIGYVVQHGRPGFDCDERASAA